MCNYRKIKIRLGNYQFVSVDANGKIGSIYFEKGRIRLVHSHGPYVSSPSEKPRTDRYIVNNLSNPQRSFNTPWSIGVAAEYAIMGWHLHEETTKHTSRGCPCFIKIGGAEGQIVSSLLKTLDDHFDEISCWESRKNENKNNIALYKWVDNDVRIYLHSPSDVAK